MPDLALAEHLGAQGQQMRIVLLSHMQHWRGSDRGREPFCSQPTTLHTEYPEFTEMPLRMFASFNPNQDCNHLNNSIHKPEADTKTEPWPPCPF